MQRHLQDITAPVIACFVDLDSRVRYYACESMYNIAKVAQSDILIFFNEIFDGLSRVSLHYYYYYYYNYK